MWCIPCQTFAWRTRSLVQIIGVFKDDTQACSFLDRQLHMPVTMPERAVSRAETFLALPRMPLSHGIPFACGTLCLAARLRLLRQCSGWTLPAPGVARRHDRLASPESAGAPRAALPYPGMGCGGALPARQTLGAVPDPVHQRLLLATVNLDHRAINEMRPWRTEVDDQIRHLVYLRNAAQRDRPGGELVGFLH
jgi:hypothetical protein